MNPRPRGGAPSDKGGAGPSAPAEISADEHRLAALRAIADLRHPHLVTVRRAQSGIGFEPESRPSLSLSEFAAVDHENGAQLRVHVRILLDALSGLATLHRAKLDGRPLSFVHGEVSPHTIFVGRDGLGKLLPLVESHWVTPAIPSAASIGYVAPERLLGDVFDQRADVFSVGVLLWEAIAAKRLFRNMRMDAIVTQLVGGKLPRPPAPEGAPWAAALLDVALQALAVDPADRWPNVGLMGAEIETIAEGCLAGPDEIALAVRKRRPTPARSGADANDGPPSPRRDPVQVNGATAMIVRSQADVPPRSSYGASPPSSGRTPAGPVAWYGPRGPGRARAPEDDPQSRRDPGEELGGESTAGSSSGSLAPARGAWGARQKTRVAWAAAGIAVGMLGVAARELFERPAVEANAIATTRRAPLDPSSPDRESAVARQPASHPEATSAAARNPRDAGATSALPVPVGAALARPAIAPAAPVRPAPAPQPRRPIAAPRGATTAAAPETPSSPPAPESPPAPKPPEDLFGI